MERLVVIDSNVLITFLTPPPTDLEAQKHHRVVGLFEKIESGEVRAILPEITLHETFYTLLGRRFPDTRLEELCDAIGGLVSWQGWSFHGYDLEICLRALDILQQDSKLEFSDSVIAARADILNAELATFDKRLAANFTGTLWSEN
jgi:predicted nucleic acid-binding protein